MSNKDSDLQGVLPKEWSFSERLALLFSPNKFQEAMEGYMEVANDKYNNGVKLEKSAQAKLSEARQYYERANAVMEEANAVMEEAESMKEAYRESQGISSRVSDSSMRRDKEFIEYLNSITEKANTLLALNERSKNVSETPSEALERKRKYFKLFTGLIGGISRYIETLPKNERQYATVCNKTIIQFKRDLIKELKAQITEFKNTDIFSSYEDTWFKTFDNEIYNGVSNGFTWGNGSIHDFVNGYSQDASGFWKIGQDILSVDEFYTPTVNGKINPTSRTVTPDESLKQSNAEKKTEEVYRKIEGLEKDYR